MPDLDDDVLDLDVERAVRREAGARPVQLKLGGKVIADLPAELPFAALAPLEALDDELAVLVHQALVLATNRAPGEQEAAVNRVFALLTRDNLPSALIAAVKTFAVELLGQDGYDNLIAARPSIPDVLALARALLKRYGIRLGESSTPSDSSGTDGTTSKATSPPSTTSTPEGSGLAPASPGS